jgi:hypothetical protein
MSRPNSVARPAITVTFMFMFMLLIILDLSQSTFFEDVIRIYYTITGPDTTIALCKAIVNDSQRLL